MDIDIEQIFAEIGRLHMQVAMLQAALTKANAKPAPPTEPTNKE